MRCIAFRDRFMSKFDHNTRRYSKGDANAQSNVPTGFIKTQMQTKEGPLVERILNYVKTWRDQQQMQLTKLDQKILKQSLSTQTAAVPDVADVPKASLGFSLLKPSAVEKIPCDAKQSQQHRKVATVAAQHEELTTPVRQVPTKLLKYPVIPLTDTINNYLASIRPLFSKEEYCNQRKIAIEFIANEGCELQKLLEKAARVEKNWLSDRWTKVTYLRHRSPVTVFSSPCISFPIQDFRDPLDYVNFAARAIYRMCEFKKLIEEDRLPVHYIHKYQLDNSQYHNVFGTVRLPRPVIDVLKQFCSNYAVVIHKNNFYKLPVCNHAGYPFCVEQLTKELLKIVSSERPKGPEIGLLGHGTRDNWAEAHASLCLQKINRRSLKIIEAALFTVSLDEHIVLSKDSKHSVLAHQLLYGGGLKANSANRWMDKTLQLIVNPNGMVGLCFEQSPADPQPAAMIMDYVQANINKPESTNVVTQSDFYKTEYLKFTEITECVELWLSTAKRNIDMIERLLNIHAFKFNIYGCSLIILHGMPPDSFIQMALQLTFYRLHWELPAQQESAHLRIFEFGRTEVIRSTSSQSWTFVFTMVSKMATSSVRWLALRNAVAYHQTQTSEALRGHGIDRHLFGLKEMAREHGRPVPDFFNSKGYLKSTDFRLVTAQASTSQDAFMASGPYTTEGYSCTYNPRENDIIFTISSWNRDRDINAKRFGKALEKALIEMGELIVENEGGMCENKVK